MVVLLLQHRNVVKPAFVVESTSPDVLAALLRSIFPSLRNNHRPNGAIVGIRHSQQGHSNDLALVCANPSAFTDRVYQIVTAGDGGGQGPSIPTERASTPEPALAVVHIGDSNEAISIHRRCIELLDRFNEATNLPTVSLATLWEVFRSRSSGFSDSTLQKKDYFDCIVELLKSENSGSPRMSDKVLISRTFDTIFDAFDRQHSGRVNFAEIVSAFTCLVGGSKSDKLSYAFEIFDDDATGLLSRNQLCSYLSSFMTMVHALATLSESNDRAEMEEEDEEFAPNGADSRLTGGGASKNAERPSSVKSRFDACADLADQIFASTTSARQADAGEERLISFEEFAKWYTNGGYNQALWLELIDGRKWPRPDLSASNSPPPTTTTEAAANDTGSTPPDGTDDRDGLQFHLQKADYVVSISVADGEAVRNLASSTLLSEVAVADVFEVVQRHASVAVSNGSSFVSPMAPFSMDKRGFNSTIQDLIPGELLSPTQQQSISRVLNNVFCAFDRANRAAVGADELALALSLFCKGSKSEKLYEAFRLFLARAQAAAASPNGTAATPAAEAANEGLLTRRAVWVMFRSFLTAILALTQDATTRPAREIFSVIDKEVVSLTASIFNFAKAARGASADAKARPATMGLGFVDFGHWYNHVGFGEMQWVELLSLKSWPTGPTAQTSSELDAAAGLRDSPDTTSTARDHTHVLMVELHTQRLQTNIKFTALDMRRLSTFLSCIDRGMFQVHVLAQVFASVGAWATQADVLNQLGRFVNFDGLDPQEAVDVMTALSQMCASFSRENLSSANSPNSSARGTLTEAEAEASDGAGSSEPGVIRVKDFLVGLTIFGWGKKSEKLAGAFEYLDEFEMGSLSMTQFGRLLKAYLSAIFSINAEVMALPSEVREELIDDAAAKVTATAFRPPDNETPPEDSSEAETSPRQARRLSLTFQEFGDWYNSQRLNCADWLQLLDMAKWPGVEEAVAAHAEDVGGVERDYEGEEHEDDSELFGKEEDPLAGTSVAHIGRFPFVCSLLPPYRTTADYSNSVCALQLSADDFANMALLQQLTSLGQCNPADVFATFAPSSSSAAQGSAAAAGGSGQNGSKIVVSAASASSTVHASGPQSVELKRQKAAVVATGDGKKVVAPATTAGPPSASPSRLAQTTTTTTTANLSVATDSSRAASARIASAGPQSPGPPSRTSSPRRQIGGALPLGGPPPPSSGGGGGGGGDDVSARQQPTNAPEASETTPSDDPGTLDEDTFNSIVRGKLIADVQKLKPDQLSFLAAVFDRLYDAYDRCQQDSVARVQVASGLCLFAKGSKSEKLQAVFDAHDSDRDGLLSRSELSSFLESLLLALVAVSLHTSSSSTPAVTPKAVGKQNAASMQLLQALCHDYSEWVSREVFSFAHDVVGVDVYNAEADSRSGGSLYRVTFEDFARWFSEDRGHEVAPWLNLYDLQVWRGIYQSICRDDESPKPSQHELSSEGFSDGDDSDSESDSDSQTSTSTSTSGSSSESSSRSTDSSSTSSSSSSDSNSTSGDYERLAMEGVTTSEEEEEDDDDEPEFESGEYGEFSADSDGIASALPPEVHQDRHEQLVSSTTAVATYFDLNVDGSGPTLRLQFTVDAIRRIRLFVACAPGLTRSTPELILQLFEAVATPAETEDQREAAPSGLVVTHAAFTACIAELCFEGAQSTEAQPSEEEDDTDAMAGERFFVSHIADIVFRYFQIPSSESSAEPVAPFPEIALAFSVFAPVKKSVKLALAFSLLGVSSHDEEDSDDEVESGLQSDFGAWEFARFFDTFLRLFFALSTEVVDGVVDDGVMDDAAGDDVRERVRSIREAAEYLGVLVVERITGHNVEDDDEDDSENEENLANQLVTFVQFAEWYTTTAHDDFSWLELLYLPKLFHFVSPDFQFGGAQSGRKGSGEGASRSLPNTRQRERSRSRSRHRKEHPHHTSRYAYRNHKLEDDDGHVENDSAEQLSSGDDDDDYDEFMLEETMTDSTDSNPDVYRVSPQQQAIGTNGGGSMQDGTTAPAVVITLDGRGSELHMHDPDICFAAELLSISEERGGCLADPELIAGGFSAVVESQEVDASGERLFSRRGFHDRVLAIVGQRSRSEGGYTEAECDALSHFFVGSFARLSALFLSVAGYDPDVRPASSPTFSLLYGQDTEGRDAGSSFLDEFSRWGVRVPARACACGLTVLGVGKKSVKLALGFKLWDRDGVGALNRLELFGLLASFLGVLSSLGSVYVSDDDPLLQEFELDSDDALDSEDEVDGSPRASARSPTGGLLLNTNDTVPIATALRQSLSATVLAVFRDLGLSRNASARVSLQEFAAWYGNGGFERVRWLELLDFRKWALATDLSFEAKDGDVNNDSEGNASGFVAGDVEEITAQHIQAMSDVTNLPLELLNMMTQPELKKMWSQIGEHLSQSVASENDGSDDDEEEEEEASMESTGSSESSEVNSVGSDACTFQLDTGIDSHLLLRFDAEDVAFLDWLRHNTQLEALSPDQLCEVLATSTSPPTSPSRNAARAAAAAARSSNVRDLMAGMSSSPVTPSISWIGFFDCMSAVLMKFMSDELEVAFESLFDHFRYYYASDSIGHDDEQEEEEHPTVDALVFSAGLTVLSGGSKSAKIACGFTLFDADGDGALTAPEFMRLIQAYIIALLALGQHNDLPAEAPGDAAQYICDRIFAESDDCASRGVISHAAFGEWYNGCGYSVIPWLELLDLRKWQFISRPPQPQGEE